MRTALTDVQRRAAKAVGIAYLLALPLAIFSEFYVHSRLTLTGDVTQFAQTVIAHERLIRLGVASTLAVAVVDVLLIAGLHLTLRPVDEVATLVATIVRIIETVIIVGIAVVDLITLRFLGGAEYLRPIGDSSLESLARLSISVHGDVSLLSLLLAGIGSTLFCWLWYRSRLVPRLLAVFGMIASAVLAGRECAVLVFPSLLPIVTIAYYGGPIFLFELAMGVWLTTRGIRANV